RHHADVVPAADEVARDLRRVTRRPADVRGPDPRDDEDLHREAASLGAGLTVSRALSRRIRASRNAQRAAKTIVETSTAAPAPVAFTLERRMTTSGISTSDSTPCASTRRPGRPIETGSDFVQPSTNWIAPAIRIRRAASVAPAYCSPKIPRMSSGMKTKTGG